MPIGGGALTAAPSKYGGAFGAAIGTHAELVAGGRISLMKLDHC